MLNRIWGRLAGTFSGERKRRASHRRLSGGTNTKPHLYLPSPREAPTDLVAGLREIDPRAELVYLGLGVWVLGAVSPNQERERKAGRWITLERKLPQEKQSMGRYRFARWHLDGFGFVDFFDESDLWNGRVLHEFRYADFRYRHNADEAFEQNLIGSDDQTDLDRRIALMLDYQSSEGLSVFNHQMRGRRSVTQRALPYQPERQRA